MYIQQQLAKTTIEVNDSYAGETIEEKIRRITNNNEPITDGAPLIYTERRAGVEPQYDIRTDRWEVAVDAMDKVSKTHVAKRMERIGEKTYDTMTPEQQKEFREKYPNNTLAKNHKTEGGA